MGMFYTFLSKSAKCIFYAAKKRQIMFYSLEQQTIRCLLLQFSWTVGVAKEQEACSEAELTTFYSNEHVK